MSAVWHLLAVPHRPQVEIGLIGTGTDAVITTLFHQKRQGLGAHLHESHRIAVHQADYRIPLTSPAWLPEFCCRALPPHKHTLLTTLVPTLPILHKTPVSCATLASHTHPDHATAGLCAAFSSSTFTDHGSTCTLKAPCSGACSASCLVVGATLRGASKLLPSEGEPLVSTSQEALACRGTTRLAELLLPLLGAGPCRATCTCLGEPS
jgi:hypothetical protein